MMNTGLLGRLSTKKTIVKMVTMYMGSGTLVSHPNMITKNLLKPSKLLCLLLVWYRRLTVGTGVDQ